MEMSLRRTQRAFSERCLSGIWRERRDLEMTAVKLSEFMEMELLVMEMV